MPLCEIQEATGNMFLVENPVGAWFQRPRSAPFSFEGISHVCMFWDPRRRRAFKRPVRYLTNSPQLLRFVVRKCPDKTCSRTGEGTHERRSEFVSLHTRPWAQAAIQGVESDAIRRHEEYPAEDVEMDLTSADTPDHEFTGEPYVEEAKVPEAIPNSVRSAIVRIHKKL